MRLQGPLQSLPKSIAILVGPGYEDLDGMVLIDGGLLGSFDAYDLTQAQEAIADLDDPGVGLAIGNPDVPVGAYARIALSLVGDAFAIRAMQNVRTNELDARGIVGKVSQGVVDAGVINQALIEPL